jgi:alpha-beta hydrolase superfamily lysophospholipase
MKAIVCLCHGYGDTCTFFLDGISRNIAAAGYGVFALDYPGFGLSEGLHGYIPSFDTLVDDVAETFAKVKGIPSFYCWFLVLFLSIYKLLGNSWNAPFVFLPHR